VVQAVGAAGLDVDEVESCASAAGVRFAVDGITCIYVRRVR